LQQEQKKQQQKQQIFQNTKLLFYSIEYHEFNAARVLLKYGTQIVNRNNESKNIVEYLVEKRKLDSSNLLFILNIVKDSSLMTPEVLCHTIFIILN